MLLLTQNTNKKKKKSENPGRTQPLTLIAVTSQQETSDTTDGYGCVTGYAGQPLCLQ